VTHSTRIPANYVIFALQYRADLLAKRLEEVDS
jgi:hypothetical protein